MAYNTVVISSGHSVNCQGMSDIINEVTEARRVVDRVYDIVKASGKTCYKYHDMASSSSQNLVNIVNFHNSHSQGVDVSIHFNACNHTSKARGVEVCYYSQFMLADEMSRNISKVTGLINRGPKERTGLYVLKHTTKPSILIEVCFGDSEADCAIYKAKFEDICQTIAKTLIGGITVPTTSTNSSPTHSAPTNSTTTTSKPSGDSWVRRLQEECNKQGFSNQKVDGIPGSNTLRGCPTLKKGASGNITKLLQEKLVALGYSTNGIDGIFGSGTKNAIIKYQKSKGLSADGIVGQNTWRKLLGL